MAQGKNTTDFTGMLVQFMGAQDPMFSMLDWLCSQMMEAEVSNKLGAEKHEQSEERTSHRCGFRPRRLDTRLGTMYLLVPKVRNGGYIPFFVTERFCNGIPLVAKQFNLPKFDNDLFHRVLLLRHFFQLLCFVDYISTNSRTGTRIGGQVNVHDEVVIEAPETAKLEDVCAIMGQTPSWAEGLLLRADGYVTDFYKKD